jgi:adenylate cyclase
VHVDDEDAARMQRDLEEVLLGGPRRYTRQQLADEAGVSLEHAKRLWVAMGFAESDDPSAVLFTDHDLAALRDVTRLVTDGVVRPEMEVPIVRALGQSLSRLAEWQTDLVRRYVLEQLAGAAEEGSELDAALLQQQVADISGRLLPIIEGLQTYAWRRHLVVNSTRAFAGAGEDVGRRTLVVGFADIVGYTRLTRQLDPHQLDDLLEHFETATMGVIAERRGWVVKTVGDEVMFAVEDPLDGAHIALELAERIAADGLVPGIRVGLAMGPVLLRFGDAFGSVVNIAARLTSVAKPDTILVDRELADALDGADGLALRSMRPVRVRGLHRLQPHALRRADGKHR